MAEWSFEYVGKEANLRPNFTDAVQVEDELSGAGVLLVRGNLGNFPKTQPVSFLFCNEPKASTLTSLPSIQFPNLFQNGGKGELGRYCHSCRCEGKPFIRRV